MKKSKNDDLNICHISLKKDSHSLSNHNVPFELEIPSTYFAVLDFSDSKSELVQNI